VDSHLLRVKLLGTFELHIGPVSLPPLESARAESLLAYLLLRRGTPQPRQKIAFLFWPESSEAQARTNLRHVLHHVKRHLPNAERFLEVTHRTIAWRADAPFRLDVADFEQTLAAARSGGFDHLRSAIELYTGDLMEGSYSEWLTEPRERLRTLYREALEALVGALDKRGEHVRALPYAERLLRHDPLREESYRLLMRLHAMAGEPARALRVYHSCTATLERELGVQPARSTRELYESLLSVAADAQPPRGPVRSAAAPLVGRALEWARLQALCRESEGGGARVALVSGEPGAGKTRLVEELRAWCSRAGWTTAEARSYAAEGSLPYAPIVSWLRTEPLASLIRKLQPAHRAELARILPELGGEAIRTPELPPTPGADRLRIFDAAAAAAASARGPLLLVADDLHWWDQESSQLLHYMLRTHRGAPILVAATARTEELHAAGTALKEVLNGLRSLELLHEIELGRLSRDDTVLLAGRFLGAPPTPEDGDRLHAETLGNPLFVTEALRAGWRPAVGPLSSISPKVQAVLEGRLDQLSTSARTLVDAASAIGREFTTALLARGVAMTGEEFLRALDELWRRRVFIERAEESYDFSHDKLRELCYARLSPALRRQYHLRFADALTALDAGGGARSSPQIAWHLDRAGAAEQALLWYPRAADEALRVHAHGEAVRLLGRALELLRTSSLAPERRDEQELSLLLAMVAPLGTVEGHAAPRLRDVQARAAALADATGQEPAPPLLRSLALTSLSRNHFPEAQAVARQLFLRGERAGDVGLAVEGHYLLGISAFWQGQLEEAERQFESAIRRYRPDERDEHIRRYGLDPQVLCWSRLANTIWFLGRAASAVRVRDEALELAEQVQHPYTRAVPLVFAGMLAIELRDLDGLRGHADGLRGWCRQHEYKAISSTLRAFDGYLLVLDGHVADGLASLRGALEDPEQTEHAPGYYACLQRILLAACAGAREPTIGLEAVEHRQEPGSGATLWAAEVLRYRAEFLASLGASSADVEAALFQSLEVSRRQRSLSLELRTAAALLRYRLERSPRPRVDEARGLLAGTLERLPERPSNPELRDIDALLDRAAPVKRSEKRSPNARGSSSIASGFGGPSGTSAADR
jgi:DNA-binding SARP family transcriptional activator